MTTARAHSHTLELDDEEDAWDAPIRKRVCAPGVTGERDRAADAGGVTSSTSTLSTRSHTNADVPSNTTAALGAAAPEDLEDLTADSPSSLSVHDAGLESTREVVDLCGDVAHADVRVHDGTADATASGTRSPPDHERNSATAPQKAGIVRGLAWVSPSGSKRPRSETDGTARGMSGVTLPSVPEIAAAADLELPAAPCDPRGLRHPSEECTSHAPPRAHTHGPLDEHVHPPAAPSHVERSGIDSTKDATLQPDCTSEPALPPVSDDFAAWLRSSVTSESAAAAQEEAIRRASAAYNPAEDVYAQRRRLMYSLQDAHARHREGIGGRGPDGAHPSLHLPRTAGTRRARSEDAALIVDSDARIDLPTALLLASQPLRPNLPASLYYACLGLPASASSSIVRRRFHALARVLHPDRQAVGAPMREITEAFQRISEAYSWIQREVGRPG